MAPLAVDPAVLDSAGAAVISVGEGLGSTVSTLTTSLAGCHAMSGDDPAGSSFGHSYDSSATKLLEAMATTRNGLCRLGDGVRISAHNYSLAEANSNIAGHSQALPAPQSTGPIQAGSAPSAVGSGVSAPAGWGWVSKYVGMIWPNGNSAKLRGAAAAWITAGTNFEVSEITGAAGPMGSIGAQQIPEGTAIAAAFTATNHCAAGVLQQCTSIATQLTSYASKIDTVHAAIIDLLSRICNPWTGIKEVWEWLTDEDEDEIRKIANDIRVIVNHFTEEVDALRRQIAKALHEATTIVSTMVRYAEKEWDNFLHTTDVGRALDHFGHVCGGVLSEAEKLIEGAWNVSPMRVMLDPKGFWHDASGSLEELKKLAGLEGEQKFEDAWKEIGKEFVHWDDWATDPFKAAGESAFDVGTLFIGGGPLKELPMLGRMSKDVAEVPKSLPTPPRAPDAAPHANAPAHTEAPKGGQPAPALKPGNALPPYGATESKTPAAPKPVADAGTKSPIAAAHAPAAAPEAGGTSALHAPVNGSGHPPGGGPSGYLPPSATHDHHGPVAHQTSPLAPGGSLTSRELAAVGHYTGLGFEDLNSALRTNTVDASQLARVEALNQALDKIPPHNGSVFRGTDLPSKVLAQYQPGSVVSDSAFLSTTKDIKVAQSPGFAGNVEFRIMSKTGRDISSLSMIPGEEEVLFKTDTKFFVVDRRSDPLTGRTIIEMIEQ
ncbi:ADP-ribosyltransferase domain-containing protein [Candidatus Mycobacterium wuenschmannii]|uniref:NAD(+)--protein-arginine ADP-ribosyltransferase n=1 Tax=Candidatus Mycobacterium wuenschmannii TaxID=3027808 RepID=A0ABY8VUK6_9MYCO|nr:ADP-ribosyltransferase domain-containing protein [Candidatus Mycobacterium wuenschmannii]WIM87333.1 ADP-ribosyltransferase domain-containing protein [Candidatus Mycobacterium wuenschmannii]